MLWLNEFNEKAARKMLEKSATASRSPLSYFWCLFYHQHLGHCSKKLYCFMKYNAFLHVYKMAYLFGTGATIFGLIVDQIGILLNGRIYKIMSQRRNDTAIDRVEISHSTFSVKS